MPNMIVWTNEMVSFLKENYQTMYYDDMARALGVSSTSVANKLRNLGLRRIADIGRRGHEWSEEEDRYLVEHYPNESAQEISEHLGINYSMVLKRSKLFGLKKSKDYDRSRYNQRYVRNYRHWKEKAV